MASVPPAQRLRWVSNLARTWSFHIFRGPAEPGDFGDQAVRERGDDVFSDPLPAAGCRPDTSSAAAGGLTRTEPDVSILCSGPSSQSDDGRTRLSERQLERLDGHRQAEQVDVHGADHRRDLSRTFGDRRGSGMPSAAVPDRRTVGVEQCAGEDAAAQSWSDTRTNLLSLSQPVIVPVLPLGARNVPRIAALRIRASTGADSPSVWRCLNGMTVIVAPWDVVRSLRFY